MHIRTLTNKKKLSGANTPGPQSVRGSTHSRTQPQHGLRPCAVTARLIVRPLKIRPSPPIPSPKKNLPTCRFPRLKKFRLPIFKILDLPLVLYHLVVLEVGSVEKKMHSGLGQIIMPLILGLFLYFTASMVRFVWGKGV